MTEKRYTLFLYQQRRLNRSSNSKVEIKQETNQQTI